MNNPWTAQGARPALLASLVVAVFVACSDGSDGGDPSDPGDDGDRAPTATDDDSNPSGAAGSGGAAEDDDPARPTTPGAGDPADPADPATPPGSSADSDPLTPLDEISEDCRGFDVVGLTHSPGGDVLPNTCAPFHGTYNNPYAIRCVDADPSYETEWQGDGYCILPPPPELGTQVYVGPTSHDDPAAYGPYVLEPGAETNTYYYANATNAEDRYFYRTNWRMRDGSHHMIISLLDADREDGWATGGGGFDGPGGGGSSGYIGGAQRTDVDRPQGTLDVPAENQGLAGTLRANQQFSFNLHHMNRFEEPILREAWVNVWYMDESEVTHPILGLSIAGSPLDISEATAGTRATLHYRALVSGNPRIVTLLGHRHAHTERFGVWIERASGETQSVYESFNYEDMPTYQYDSVSDNPVADIDMRIDGGHSGMLELVPGDRVHFVCDINNTSDVNLRFANELQTGEMCILFGSYTGEGSFGRAERVMD